MFMLGDNSPTETGKSGSARKNTFVIVVVAIAIFLLVVSFVPEKPLSQSANASSMVQAPGGLSSMVAPSGNMNGGVSSALSNQIAKHDTSGIGEFSKYVSLSHKQFLSPVSGGPVVNANTPSTITFVDHNLALGTSWSVSVIDSGVLNNHLEFYTTLQGIQTAFSGTTTSGSMTGQLSNGIYFVFAGPHNADMLMGMITVKGADQTFDLNFPNVYKVTLSETGLTGGTGWSASLVDLLAAHPVFYSNSSVSSSLVAYVPNSSLNVYAGIGNPDYHFASFVVYGAPENINLKFPKMYKVTLSEMGLSAGISWMLSISDPNNPTHYFNSSTSSSIVAYLPNGTFAVQGGPGSIVWLQTLTVDGSDLSVTLSFPTFYKTTIEYSGLPPGNYTDSEIQSVNESNNGFASYVFYNNISESSTVIAYLPDGVYFNHYYNTYYGSTAFFAVTGQASIQHFSYPRLYNTTFVSTGLQTGLSWSVYVWDNNYSYEYDNSSSSIYNTVYAPDGTYSYQVVEGGAYATNTGTFTVAGYNQTVSVILPTYTFYRVTFQAQDYVPGSTVTVTVTDSNGTVFSYLSPANDSSNIVQLYLPNGYYNYSAWYSLPYSPGVSGTLNYPTTEIQVAGFPSGGTINFPLIYPITFTPVNLNPGYYWYLKLQSTGNATYQFENIQYTSGPTTVYVPEAYYTYTAEEVSTNDSYFGLPYFQYIYYSSAFQDNGTILKLNVNFPTLYKVTFTQTGLNSGMGWGVRVSNSGNTVSYYNTSSGTPIVGFLPSGTYSSFALVDGIAVATISVTVVTSSQTVNFVLQTVYRVDLHADDINQLSSWQIYIENASADKIYVWNGLESTNSVYLQDGSYTYYAQDAYSHHLSNGFTVSNANLLINLTFPGHYHVNVSQVGLAPGADWYFNLSGVWSGPLSYSSVFEFNVTNGTYLYSVESNDSDYAVHGSPFTLTVTGSNQSLGFTFFPTFVKYNVQFTESGLPTGTMWYLNISGQSSLSSSTGSISTQLRNATYSYTVSNSSEYYAEVSVGSFVVNGSSVSETVQYEKYAYINGTISPTNATIKVNGKTVSISGGAFSLKVTSGTYNLVASLSGYKTYYNNMTLNPGDSKNLTIQLSKQTSNPGGGFLGGTNTIYYILGGVVAIIAIAGVAFALRRKKT